MKRSTGLIVGIAFFISAVVSTAYAQGPGMSGMGNRGMPGFDGEQMDHNLVIPQVAVGQDYVTTLVLLNLGDSHMMSWVAAQNLGTSGTIYFHKQDGTPFLISVNGGAPVSKLSFSLGPSASARYELTATGTTTAGWALVDIDPPAGSANWGMMDGQAMTGGMRVLASVYYAHKDGAQTTSRVGVTASMYEMGRFFNSEMPVQSQGSMYTGVAIVNTSAQAASIQVQLRDASGSLFASRKILLPAGNQLAKFVNQMFDNMPADFTGSMQIQTSDEGVVAMGLLMSGGIMTSIPMIHYGQMGMM